VYLAIDSATDRPSFALGTADDPGAPVVLADRHDLSRAIEASVRDLLQRRQVAATELAGVIVADGPGSFTGLRIGIAFAKGMSRAANLPLIAIPSMLGAAYAARGEGDVTVEYDALRGDVYRAIYRFALNAVEIRQHPTLQEAGGRRPEAGENDASAASLLRLHAVAGAARLIENPGAWEPVYGRLAEAEARRKAGGDTR
jgi:tRNA threonylcarbamoyl adenosine modification protein YeaZ